MTTELGEVPWLTAAELPRPVDGRERSEPCRITGAAGFGAGSLAGRTTVGAEPVLGVVAALGPVTGRCALQREREEESGRVVVVPPTDRDGGFGVTARAAGAGVNALPLLFLCVSDRDCPPSPRGERAAGSGCVVVEGGKCGR